MALPFPTAQAVPVPVAPPARLLADAWCAAFLWPKTREALPAVTHDTWRWLHLAPERVSAATQATITRLASQYHVLHWHVAFPEVFALPDAPEPPENARAGWHGGFDVVLGKPPWQPLTARAQMGRAMPLLRHIRASVQHHRRDATVSRALPRNRSAPDTSHRAYRLPHTGAAGHNGDSLLPDAARAGRYSQSAHDHQRHAPHATSAAYYSLEPAYPDWLARPTEGADMVWGVRQLDELDDATRHVMLKADDIALSIPTPAPGQCSGQHAPQN